MVMSDKEPRKTFVLNRGQYDEPTDTEVAPSAPGMIMPTAKSLKPTASDLPMVV